MGLYYKTMIKEILAELPSDLDQIELFLKNKEQEYQDKYKIGGQLYYLNILELLRQINIKSEYFELKLKENSEFN